jgi:hypothetical protein
MEDLKDEIISFYDGAVNDHFAERLIHYYQQKKEKFRWLFGDKDRIELEISEEEAIKYFFSNNYLFSSLYWRTDAFFRQGEEAISDMDLKRAIYRNRITYKKNTYKFSKFFRRFVERDSDENKVDFQNFYDCLKTAKCVISIYPLDFIGASENASYNSCYSKDSCHHTGTSAYLRDEHTIIAYTKIGTRKIGRQWIYFDRDYIIIGKIYGSISSPIEESLRLKLEEEYARHLNVSNNWVISTEIEVDSDCISNAGHEKNCHCDYAVYFDLEVESILRHKENTSGFCGIDLVFEDGMDRWGEDSTEGHMLFDYCYQCNRSINNEGTYVNDELVCDHCLGEYYIWCEECEEYHHIDNSSYYIEDLHYNICQGCIDNGNFAECCKTGTYWSIDEMVSVVLENKVEILVSAEYAEEHYQRCDQCHGYHEKLIKEDNNMSCTKCFNELYQLDIDFEAA